MDKATKVAVEKYPHGTFDGELGDSLRAACAVGYIQAEKDITDRARFSSGMDGFYYGRGYKQAEEDVWDRIEKYLSERNPTDFATVGWILKNIEEYKKKIMEE